MLCKMYELLETITGFLIILIVLLSFSERRDVKVQ